MTEVMADTHTLLWWATEPERLSDRARTTLRAEQVVVASVTWWEIAWLVRLQRIGSPMPTRAWLHELAGGVRTAALTPAIASSAAELPDAFGRDPFDRLIYATAVETGLPLVSGDRAMRAHDKRAIVIW